MRDELPEDEITQRRSQRGPAAADEFDDDKPVKYTWSETFALIIAAYQVLLPIILAMVGAVLVVYLLFRVLFH